MLITQDDIQGIGDEETLLHFLQEKLNLSISEGATLEQIALPLPLPFLGIDESIAEQIRDCRDLSGNPKKSSGRRRPFLIRFRSKQNYPEILRDVANSLSQKYADPADLFFICATESFQPFAFAYFNDSSAGDWSTSPLTLLAWTQKNTYIHTSYEHELSASFFTHESSVEFDGVSDDNIDFEEEKGFSEKDVPSNETEVNAEDDPLKKLGDAPLDRAAKRTSSGYVYPTLGIIQTPDHTDHRVKRTSSRCLLAKLENSGTPLEHFNIYDGITVRYPEAFLISEPQHRELIDADTKSCMLIKSQLQLNLKWRATSTSLICIPNSDEKSWPWSDSESVVKAEEIFAKHYPAIRGHLRNYRDELRTPNYKGKFYWELPSYKYYSELRKSKIVCPYTGNSMRACYDQSGAVVLKPAFFIPTESLSLLAILNSTLFDWYAKTKYQEKSKGPIEFKQSNIASFPVAAETIEQKAELSNLVQQILNSSDSPEVPAIERKIDALVYKLYDLTASEIELIEEESNQ